MRSSQTESKDRYVRFYRWARADFAREVEQGYPLLRSMQSVTVMALLKMMDALPIDEQNQVAAALVKRSHPVACDLVGETLTGEEKAFVDDRLKYRNRYTGDFMTELRERTGEGCVKTDRGKFKTIVIETLTPMLGSVIQPRTRLSWAYLTHVGDFQLNTTIDLTSTWSIQLRYWHSVTAADGTHVHLSGSLPFPILAEPVNILAWLGIGQASWDTPYVRDLQPAAESLATICGHFLRELPAILGQ